MTALTVENLTARRGRRSVVDGATLRIEPGEVVGLVGPNGAGKTSLMRAALGLLPAGGGSDLARLAPRDRARRAAWMPQSRDIAWPVSVEALVTLGRIPYLPGGAEDRKAVEAALDRLGLSAFRARKVTELSGGEQALVLIARAVAQETPLLVADEPIAGLDPAHQIDVMELFADLARDGRAVWLALHDLALAARYCHRLILMDRGRIVADGAPREVLAADNLDRVFGISARFDETTDGPAFRLIDRVRR